MIDWIFIQSIIDYALLTIDHRKKKKNFFLNRCIAGNLAYDTLKKFIVCVVTTW